MADKQMSWYQGLTKYQWWVLVIGVMAWTFDCMDQRLFVLSRAPAVKELMGWNEREIELVPQITKDAAKAVDAEIAAGKLTAEQCDKEVERRVVEETQNVFNDVAAKFGNIVTALMIVGWAVGGFFFGVYGDRLGRVKTLSMAIGVYSIFTGLSGFSVGLWDFCTYRFLMGCGIGGAFATSATLIAETMPTRSRAAALGVFQALSALGNIAGSAIARFLVSPDLKTNLFGLLGEHSISGWRILFMLGVIPAILVVIIMRSIHEPDAWKEAQNTASDNLGRQLGDLRSLFGTQRWRRNMLVGLGLAVVGVIGLWGVGFYTPELVDAVLEGQSTIEKSNVKAMGTLLQDVGALCGMLAFTYVATRIGRRIAFGGAMIFAWLVVTGVFLFLNSAWQAYVLFPILGFATLSLFGGYSIYFPELFPTRLRASGVGFCYNVGRILAAAVILFKIPIRDAMNAVTGAGNTEVFRYVSVVLASVYLFGLVILIWAPETKDKPLPTED